MLQLGCRVHSIVEEEDGKKESDDQMRKILSFPMLLRENEHSERRRKESRDVSITLSLSLTLTFTTESIFGLSDFILDSFLLISDARTDRRNSNSFRVFIKLRNFLRCSFKNHRELNFRIKNSNKLTVSSLLSQN